jgi:hypothetical protein
VKIGAVTELIAKREQPTARQRRKLFTRKVVIAMRPHQVFALACRLPGTKCLAANKWPKHLALNPAAAVACGNQCDVILDPIDVDDIRFVASRLYSEHRASERAVGEGDARASNTLERFSRVWRKQNPWASGCVVKTESLRADRPPYEAITQSNLCAAR